MGTPINLHDNVILYTNFTGSATSQQFGPMNGSRVGMMIFNNSTANLYVAINSIPTTTDFSVKLAAGAYYELPYGVTGVINGVWDAASGSGLVTEISTQSHAIND